MRLIAIITALFMTLGLCLCVYAGEVNVQSTTANAGVSEEVKVPEKAFEFGGHYYSVFNGYCPTWEDARDYCNDIGGYLAVITSKEENDTIFSYVTSNGYNNAYFGFTDREEEGVWKWVNGEMSDYTNWGGSEPNNETANENYGMFYWKFTDGTWNDGNFGRGTLGDEKIFICEWDSLDACIAGLKDAPPLTEDWFNNKNVISQNGAGSSSADEKDGGKSPLLLLLLLLLLGIILIAMASAKKKKKQKYTTPFPGNPNESVFKIPKNGNDPWNNDKNNINPF